MLVKCIIKRRVFLEILILSYGKLMRFFTLSVSKRLLWRVIYCLAQIKHIVAREYYYVVNLDTQTHNNIMQDNFLLGHTPYTNKVDQCLQKVTPFSIQLKREKKK